MTSKRFDPEKDLAPMPFDERICLQALEMKKCGLVWRPHVGCFVWDPDEFITPTSPFPVRIYFILSISRFIEIFDTIEQMVEKLVWLPTWHQARLVCRQLSIADEAIAGRWQSSHNLFPEKDLMHIYALIVEALQHGEPSA